jgi:hypothetical protein
MGAFNNWMASYIFQPSGPIDPYMHCVRVKHYISVFFDGSGAFLYRSMGPQHCVCVVDVRKIPTYIYTDTWCFTDFNIKIRLNMKFYAYLYAYLYGSMGPQHCIRVVDVRKITTYIYTDTQCFTDQWGHYLRVHSH